MIIAHSEENVIERLIDQHMPIDTSTFLFDEFYDIIATVNYLQSLPQPLLTVALQFPDSLLKDAAAVVKRLHSILSTDIQLFVLADTQYGSCCVDDVAAQHVNAQAIVHYGPSCLSNTTRVPVYYVFGILPLNTTIFTTKLAETIDITKRILVLYDVMYTHAQEYITKSLNEKGFERAVVSIIQRPESTNARTVPLIKQTKACDCIISCTSEIPSYSIEQSTVNCKTSDTLFISSPILLSDDSHNIDDGVHNDNGRLYQLEQGTTLADYVIVYIGSSSNTLINICIMNSTSKVLSYTPENETIQIESKLSSQALRKRYVMMQKARDADVYGIVMGTLSVVDYLTAYDHVKQIVKQAGKKYYTFVLGKLNPAKLANFMEIDAFVLIACPESTLIDSKEFYQPVVTPYELEIALQKDGEWTSSYVLDFRQLTLQEQKVSEEELVEEDALSDQEEPYFSLMTGTYKTKKTAPSNQAINRRINNTTDLTVRNGASLAVLSSSAAHFLQRRSWQGLDRTQAMAVTDTGEGRHGIASRYTGEVAYDAE